MKKILFVTTLCWLSLTSVQAQYVSQFQSTAGLPILHSRDLVNWQIIGYALKSLYKGDAELTSGLGPSSVLWPMNTSPRPTAAG